MLHMIWFWCCFLLFAIAVCICVVYGLSLVLGLAHTAWHKQAGKLFKQLFNNQQQAQAFSMFSLYIKNEML